MIKPVVRIFQEMITDMERDLLATLQANNLQVLNDLASAAQQPAVTEPEIKAINYQPTYLKEVIETESQIQRDPNPDNQSKAYPLIMLLQGPEEHGTDGWYGTTSLQIALCMFTQETYKWDERYTVNFEPILYPMYEYVIEWISNSAYFVQIGDDGGVKHLKEDKPFWGKDGLTDAAGNKFTTPVDVILISNLRLKLNNKTTC